MLNLIDIVIAVLVLFYLLKNAGGVLKTIKNIVFALIFLVLFAILAKVLIDSAMVSGDARKTLEGSYFVNFSTNMIKWAYPSVKDNAPKVDAFIQEKIINTPTKEVKAPEIKIKVKIPDEIDLLSPALPAKTK